MGPIMSAATRCGVALPTEDTVSNEWNGTEGTRSDSAEASNLQPHSPVEAAASAEGAPEKLDAIEDIDFLLEEIENKIAPLALA